METLVLTADGGRARGFAERRRHGRLGELPDWSRTAPEADRHRGKTGGSTLSPGSGRSNVHDAAPADAAEKRFLEGLAHELERAAVSGAFERLVLIAPPRALGVLKHALGPHASRRLECADPHDRFDETADQIRGRLRALRVPA